MKFLWYILAFGLSVTLHATLLLFGDPTHNATIPVNQGHATLSIRLVASVATPEPPEPPKVAPVPAEVLKPEPKPIEAEKTEKKAEKKVSGFISQNNHPDTFIHGTEQPVEEPQSVIEPEQPTEQPVQQVQSAPEPVKPVEQPVAEPIKQPTTLPTPASVDANSDPQPQGVTTKAQLSDPIRPVYPLISRRRGEEGTVSVEVQITAKGLPRSVVITHSSGHRRLDSAAIKACRKARYIPAMREGRQVDSTFRFQVVFHLQNQD